MSSPDAAPTFCDCDCHVDDESDRVPLLTDPVEAAVACDRCRHEHTRARLRNGPLDLPKPWSPEADKDGS